MSVIVGKLLWSIIRNKTLHNVVLLAKIINFRMVTASHYPAIGSFPVTALQLSGIDRMTQIVPNLPLLRNINDPS